MLVFVWLAVVGACIGSFLNVVIYRLPAGKSIITPPSSCPKCGHRIRWYHNLPVIGWLVLRGRCYDCKAPIAPRYPLVELLVGAVFFVVALLIFNRADDGPPASMMPVSYSPSNREWIWRPWTEYVCLVGLFCCIMAAMLIRYDRHRVPRGIWFATVIFVAGLAASFWF
jgi:prepilin signal peptidase PulO-like enzyme (type II secretory pathway)